MRAADVGELVGVSATTIGQWARHGYIRPSVSGALPHLYAVEDVGEASIVAALLERGVRHRDVRSAIDALRHYGAWPLSEAELATSDGAPRARVVLYEDGDALVLGERGWQQSVFRPDSRPVRLRLRRRGRRGT